MVFAWPFGYGNFFALMCYTNQQLMKIKKPNKNDLSGFVLQTGVEPLLTLFSQMKRLRLCKCPDPYVRKRAANTRVLATGPGSKWRYSVTTIPIHCT